MAFVAGCLAGSTLGTLHALALGWHVHYGSIALVHTYVDERPFGRIVQLAHVFAHV